MIKPIKPDGEFVGSFIIASPFVVDSEFSRSVILMTNHNHETKVPGKGYSGFKINHVTQNKGAPSSGNPSYNGGRISRKVAYLIHTSDIKWDRTKEITSELCITNLEKSGIDTNRDIMPEKYIIVYGCCFWAPGQLEEQIRNGIWIPSSGDSDLIFEVPAISRWYQAYNKIRATPECISMDSARC
jgi:putative transcriptional regulator